MIGHSNSARSALNKTVMSGVLGLALGAGSISYAVAQTGTSSTTSKSPVVQISAEQERDLVNATSAVSTVSPLTLERLYYPSLGAGIPSGFGANWGDVMIGAAYSGSDNQRSESDGSMSFSAGLLDSTKFVGLELSANMLSMRNFGDNWSFDAKVHRMLYQGERGYLSVALGRNNFACSGSNACSSTWPTKGGLAPNVASNYLVLSGLTPVQNPFGAGTVPLNVSLGVGNGNFSNDMSSGAQYSVFGDIGIQLHDQFGTSVGWSGKGLNANLSFVPVKSFPLVMNVLFADITNRTPAGFNVIVTAGMPFNFLR